ncbi:MAG: hypothetical protein ACOYJ1_06265 [Peptococcales bacterium]
MRIREKKEKFLTLVDELKKCGYLESEIYAIAKIDYTEFDILNGEKLSEGIKILEGQLNFAKKCLKAI